MRPFFAPFFPSALALVTAIALLSASAVSYAEEHEDSAMGSKTSSRDSTKSKSKKSDSSDDADGTPKPKSKSSAKSAAAQREKEDAEADQLAIKIAAKIADIRKENEKLNPVPPLHHTKKRTPVAGMGSGASAGTAMNGSSGLSAPLTDSMITGSQATASARNKIMPHGASLASDSFLMSARPIGWSYEGEGGPARWSKIDPANAKCDTGERQSPIDIRDGIHVDLEPIVFNYKPVRFNVSDTGHTIQVNLSAGNSITLMGRRYDLTQFQFHKPSEEHINGRSFAMSVDLVHRDDEGKMAIVSILIEVGKSNPLIQTIWNDLPLEKNSTSQPISLIDINQLLPVSKLYYTYMGSLTTPPCTEGVLWMVLKEPIEVTQEQISIFGRLYSMNARPIQSDSGRLIKESN